MEADGGDQSEATATQHEEAVKASALSNEEGEVQSAGEVKEVFATPSETAPHNVSTTNAGEKRKRGDTDTSYAYGKKHASRSARGFVRELDSAVAEDQILDYGDEPSTTEDFNQIGSAAAQGAEHGRESQARPAEGKKIWWPIIEAN